MFNDWVIHCHWQMSGRIWLLLLLLFLVVSGLFFPFFSVLFIVNQEKPKQKKKNTPIVGPFCDNSLSVYRLYSWWQGVITQSNITRSKSGQPIHHSIHNFGLKFGMCVCMFVCVPTTTRVNQNQSFTSCESS